ncbi:MAG: hypothetical protein Q7V57_01845 [Actinomycetota bacterium]|nr:hypothetical protein [Actinomycetota bacterium]
MTGSPLLKRMLDAGVQFTETSQEQAEKLVKEFVKAGQARRKDSEELVRTVVERGRTASEHLVATVQAELNKQLGRFAGRLDELEARVEDLAKRLGLPSKPAKKASAKKAAPTTQTPVKKVALAKKAPAKKAPAKKAPAKKAPAKKAAPSA